MYVEREVSMTVGDGIFWSTVVCFGFALVAPFALLAFIAVMKRVVDHQ